MSKKKATHVIGEWMPFYARRFFGDPLVMPLSDSAKVLYIELLWHQWEHGSIPEADANVRRACTLANRKFTAAWREVVQFFPCCGTGTRRNANLEAHREERLNHLEDRSLHGKKGADGRWRKDDLGNARAMPNGDARAMPEQWHRDGEENIAPPPPRLLMALACWDATRPPNIAHAPKPSPQLVAMFQTIDAPHLDWLEVIAWVFANPFTNGLGKPSKGNTSGYRADFTWMLKPKNLITATTRVVDPESMTASPQRDRDAAIIAESIRITERTANRKAIQ